MKTPGRDKLLRDIHSGDWLLDKAGNLVYGLRQQLQGRIAAVEQQQPGQEQA
jgi:hypothetical protein